MKTNTTYSVFSPTPPLTLGSFGMDVKERYKVENFFNYQEMKDQINSESILV